MRINMKPTATNITLLLVFVVAVIVFGPLLTVWSINTLFNLNIGYNFYTWAAALWLGAILSGGLVSRNKD